MKKLLLLLLFCTTCCTKSEAQSVVDVTRGGTSRSSLTSGSLLYGNGTGAVGLLALGANGKILSISGGALTWIDPPATGVTSVALTVPSFLTVAGSPVTSSGTLAVSLVSQAANTFLAAPNGSSGTPTFRSVVLADFPSIADQALLGNNSGGPGVPSALNSTTARSLLGLGTAALAATTDFVAVNAPIAGATKTKITYDAKGLVTSGADATTADIASSTDKNYVTDAQLTIIGNTSGTNTGDQTLNSLLPPQGSNAGKFLTTNGTDASWATVSSGTTLPDSSGHSGQTITTRDGVLGWGGALDIPMDTVAYNPVWNYALRLINPSQNDGVVNTHSLSPGLMFQNNYSHADDIQSPSQWLLSSESIRNSSKSYFYMDHRIDGNYISDVVFGDDSSNETCFWVMSTNSTDFKLSSGVNSDFQINTQANTSFHWIPPIDGGSSGQVLTTDGTGLTSWADAGGTGTVTDASVVTANGFAGSVANSTSTPAITLSTTVTGVLKGNGTAISAATSGTDYSAGTSGLSTGILKSTTTTGNLTIAVAGDFPTLNQNTTGSAATLTTPRAIYGNNFDGSAALTQIIASTFGGTGNGFTKFTGPTTSEKTFTLPNASATILTDNAAVTVAQGGLGVSSLTAYSVLCGGTTSTGAVQSVSGVGTSGQVLTSNGAGALPTWQDASGGGGGISSATNKGAMYATGATTGTSTGAMGDGQLLVGSSSGNPALATLTGTSNQIIVTNGANSITLATPQNIATTSSPTFSGLTLSSLFTQSFSTAKTNAFDTTQIFNLNTSGSPATGLGQRWVWNLDGTAANKPAAMIDVAWTIESLNHSKMSLWAFANSSVAKEVIRLDGGLLYFPSILTGGTSTYHNFIFAKDGSSYIDVASATPAIGWDNTNSRLGWGTAMTSLVGISFPLHLYTTSSATNVITDLACLDQTSSGTPAASFGTGLLWRLKSSTTIQQNAARNSVFWTDATHATRTSAIKWETVYQGTTAETFRSTLTSTTASNIQIGTPSSISGSLKLANSGDADLLTIAAPSSIASSLTITLPGTAGASGQTMTSDGSGGLSFADLGVAHGGTGATTLTSNGVLYGNGTSAIAATSAGTDGQRLVGVTSGAPVFRTNANSQSTPSDPAAIGAATSAMLGLAASITPTATGKILIIISFDVELGAADNSTYQIAYGTGTAPSNGAAFTGTTVGSVIRSRINSAISSAIPVTLNAIVTGLTLSTTYWVDVQATNSTGNPTANNFSISIIEL